MHAAKLIVFACMMLYTTIALVCDLRTQKLPNVLVLPTFCAGLVFHAVNGFVQSVHLGHSGLSGTGAALVFSLEGFATGFGLLLLLWFVGGSGAGDVKFMGALGCWLGTWLTFQVLIVSAVLASLLSIVILSSRVFQMKRLSVEQAATQSQRAGKKKKTGSASARPLGWRVPFGVPAAVATWCVLGLELSGYGIPWPLLHVR